MKRVLFVCLGNICRSPMAQGVMEHYLRDNGLEDRLACDSCGTGHWHVGEPPDSRTRLTLQRHGIRFHHAARALEERDFRAFDLILAMDRSVLREVLRRSPPEARNKIRLYRDFDPQGSGDLDDPYYGDLRDFEEVFHICDRTTPRLVRHLLEEVEIPQTRT